MEAVRTPVMNRGSHAEDEGFSAVASAVRERLFHEILYELQTGGGIDLPATERTFESDRISRELEAIRMTLGRIRSLFTSAPNRVASWLSGPNLHVLDLGAGKAPWSAAIALRHRTVSVTGLDLPSQIPALKEAVNAAGVSQQFAFVGVDMFSSDWPIADKYDLVVIGNVCHLFNEYLNREMLSRAALRLRPGGKLAIIDQVLDDDPDWKRWSALYLLGVLHCAPGGNLFPVKKYVNWLNDLGFIDPASRAICPLPPLTLITALRAS